ncbi:MAG: undecaprenyldiphospho-muramoylpentapeptide beta-N-acetylglucosaminyltransferase, partial [Firmicutes bacterium]|nr:undecaprenyldiphospho-muramoylpentapeptide beta-N-acetylglucosaminyltransferase [Bacillota bacterium]
LVGLPRKLSPRVLLAAWLAGKGLLTALCLIKRFRPDLVVGTGGYVCGPVVLAAVLCGVPSAIQEQNAFPGLTNRLLGRLVRRVFLGYEEAARYFPPAKIMVTGNPIRRDILGVERVAAAGRLGLDPALTTILVMGASQGARSLNEALLTCLPRLLLQPRLQVLHIAGRRNYETVQEALAHLRLPPAMAARVVVAPYIYNIADAYAVADLVVSRAGAISLAEMTARGLPLILVPFPYAAADHQVFNARALEAKGAARVILDRELDGERLYREIAVLLRDPSRLVRMRRASQACGRPEATEKIVTGLMDLLDRRRTSFSSTPSGTSPGDR